MAASIDPLAQAVRTIPSSAAEAMLGTTSAAELKRSSVRGGMMTVIAQGLTFVLQTGSMIILARLLSPADFGLQGMVVALTGLLGLFRDGGLGTASVQQKVLTHEQTSTLFWINVAVGAALMVITVAIAPFLAEFYREPRLVSVARVSATAFLFNGLAVQHRALLYRNTRFVAMAQIDFTTLLVSTAVGVGLALLGWGYWALVAMAITNPLITAIAVWIAMPWLPGRPKPDAEIRAMLHFGGKLTVNTLIVYLAYNTDNLLLGRFKGAEALGLYGRAYQLANLPLQQLYTAISNVAFPVLSRAQHDAALLHRSFLKVYAVVVSATVPLAVTCAVFGEEIVRVFLGPRWIGAGNALRLLAPMVLAFALINPFGWFLLATGRVGRSVKIALMIALVVPMGVWTGLPYGPSGVALGFSTAMVILTIPCVAWSVHNTGITLSNFWEAIKRPLAAGVLAATIGWAVNSFLQSTLSPLPRLIIGMSVSLGTYAAILLVVMGQAPLYVELLRHAFRRPSAKSVADVLNAQ